MTHTMSLINLLLATTMLAVPTAARSQTKPSVTAQLPTIRVAKWALLGASLGLGAYALAEHGRAERRQDALRSLCQTQPERCAMADGRYEDGDASRLAGEARRAERHARAAIIGGQITLLGSAVLFLIDLRDDGAPGNIPYPSPHAAPFAGWQLTVGARLRL